MKYDVTVSSKPSYRTFDYLGFRVLVGGGSPPTHYGSLFYFKALLAIKIDVMSQLVDRGKTTILFMSTAGG